MSEVMKIPSAEFLVDSGLLFEINRTVLHPLGLAIEVQVREDGSMQFGDLWDYRNDPEGMLYDPETFKQGLAKFTRFMEEFGTAKLDERLRTLGFTVQDRTEQGEVPHQ